MNGKTTPPTDLAKWIMAVRKSLGMTREKFAEAIASDAGSIVKWERGERERVDPKFLRKILSLASADLRSSCPVTADLDPIPVRGTSDPSGTAASSEQLLEAALERRAATLPGPVVLAISREMHNLRGVPRTLEDALAVVDALARAYAASSGSRGSGR